MQRDRLIDFLADVHVTQTNKKVRHWDTDRQTDTQTDGRMDGEKLNYVLPVHGRGCVTERTNRMVSLLRQEVTDRSASPTPSLVSPTNSFRPFGPPRRPRPLWPKPRIAAFPATCFLRQESNYLSIK